VYDFNTLLYAGLARQKMCVRSATPLHSAKKHYFDLIFGQLQSPIHFTHNTSKESLFLHVVVVVANVVVLKFEMNYHF